MGLALVAAAPEEPSGPAAEIRGYSAASGGEYRVATVSPQNSRTAYPVLGPSRTGRTEPAAKTAAGDRCCETCAVRCAVRSTRTSQLYFDVDPMGQKWRPLEPWAPGQEPQLEDLNKGTIPTWPVVGDPRGGPQARAGGFKLASFPPDGSGKTETSLIPDSPVERSDLPPVFSVAEGRRRQRRRDGGAERRGDGRRQAADVAGRSARLDERGRAKAERCLAEAVYFEAEGSPPLARSRSPR